MKYRVFGFVFCIAVFAYILVFLKFDIKHIQQNLLENIKKSQTEDFRKEFEIYQESKTLENDEQAVVLDTTNKKKKENAEKINIMFVKTHKTASSTVQNIIYRYGLKRNLSFAMPKNSHDYNYPEFFNKRAIAFPETQPFNIMCNHMRYQHERVHEIMPNDSIYISILREPGGLFISSFYYFYNIVPEFHRVPQRGENSTEYWLDHASEYFYTKTASKYSFFARNHMMFDLGFKADLSNETEIDKVVQAIAKIFDLMLIFDHLDESLVLLADLLGCSLKDVSSVKLNSRKKEKFDSETSKRISEKARRWNKADAALFDYFNKTLWRKIKEYGFEKMKNNVKKLQTMNYELTEACVSSNKTVPYSELKNAPWKNMPLYQPKGVTITGYDLKPGAEKNMDCVYTVAPEKVLSQEVFKKQKQRLS